MNIRKRLPAFESRDYRLWFAGQSVSLVGTWLQNTGQSWLVLQLTNSPLRVGMPGAEPWGVLLLASDHELRTAERRGEREAMPFAAE